MLQSMSPGWYVVRTNSGAVGLILHRQTGPIRLGSRAGTVTQAAQVNRNPNEDFQSVISNRGPDIEQYLRDLGATPQQSLEYMSEAESGVGARGRTVGGGILDWFTGLTGTTPVVPGRQATQLLIPTHGQPTASSGRHKISTHLGQAPDVGSSTAEGVRSGVTTLADSIGSSLDFLKWIAWIFHPLNLLRGVEFLTGLALMFYGLNTLMHGMRRSSATHRTTVTGMFRSLFNKTPVGRATQIRRARRRGRRAGQVQAERDVAYRGARQERARRAGAGQRTTPGSSTGGTGQGSSALEASEE